MVEEYVIVRIISKDGTETRSAAGFEVRERTFSAEIIRGQHRGERIVLVQSDASIDGQALNVDVGQTVVALKTPGDADSVAYTLVDHYRVPQLLFGVACCVALIILLGKRRGFAVLIGLVLSAVLIIFFVIPRLAAGYNPLGITLHSAVMILSSSLFLAHGWNARTRVAFISTIITLGISTLAALAITLFARMSGMGTEESLYVMVGIPGLNMQYLFLSGVILGTLGVLDDITTAQSAVVEELHHANETLDTAELYKRGLSVGREHIASLVNTLFLAYAGVSLPLFLLFSLGYDGPWWMVLNNQLIAEEVVRTLVGSACLMLAVPITTGLAAWWFGRVKR